MTVKQTPKLTDKFENRESVIKLVKDYGIVIQNAQDTKNNETNFMEFVSDFDSGARLFNCESMESYHTVRDKY